MTNDVPDRVWLDLKTETTDAGTEIGYWWSAPHPLAATPYLRATPARERAEELVEALRFYANAQNWKGDPEAWERVVADCDPEALDAMLSDVEIDGGKRARNLLASLEQEPLK